MIHKAIIQTPIGKLEISTSNSLLTRLDFLSDDKALIPPNDKTQENIVNQLNHYFLCPSYEFSIPYHLEGTPFQKKVWQALSNLTIQKTVSYGVLAKKLKTGARAVGNACRANPLPILIPCHRVLAKGSIGGYKGTELAIKKWLLNHESHTTAL